MIEISELTVMFGGVRAISALTAELNAAVTGLIGPNGAGKTTLLNVLSGFVQPMHGAVKIDGADILRMPAYRRSSFGLRRTFQTEQVVLNLSVWDNVAAVLDHVPHPRDVHRTVHDALVYVGLLDQRERMGGELSTSDRRMVEIARGIVGSPRLIMMDEPGAGLSEAEASHLRRIIMGIPAQFGAQILLVDHDVDLISETCSETLVLDFGIKIAEGPTSAVLKDRAVRTAYLGETA